MALAQRGYPGQTLMQDLDLLEPPLYVAAEVSCTAQSQTGGVLGAVPSAAVSGRHSKCIINYILP